MKKLLLFGAAALTAASAMALEPSIYENTQALQISPDGKMLAGEDNYGTVSIIDLTTGETTVFEGGEMGGYAIGFGNAYSANGILVGDDNELASYLRDGVWYSLSVPNPQFGSYARGITPDGTRICGTAGLAPLSLDDTAVPMQAPFIWNQEADGSYSEAVALPYPDKDFSGRVPQYVTALCISSDGKTVFGLVTDYSGSIVYPITYREQADGTWAYETKFDDMINPDHITLPEDPGDGPAMPSMIDFMSEESKAAYEQAVEDWQAECEATENWDYSTYPNMEDFIDDEDRAEYDQAVEAYTEEFEAWYEKSNLFYDAFNQLLASGNPMVFNNARLSSDGKKGYGTGIKTYEDPESYFGYSELYLPVCLDLETGDFTLLGEETATMSGVADNGTIVAQYMDDLGAYQTLIYLPGREKPLGLRAYYEAYMPQYADWIKENMFHTVKAYDPETWEPVEISDYEMTGIPVINNSMSVLATTVENYWDYSDVETYVYVLPSMEAGVKAVAIEKGDFTVRVMKGGVVCVEGEADSVLVYDINGRLVFSGDAAAIVNTGLANGTYIVKVTSGKFNRVVKAIF